jgi:cytochrome d ubiquinol oxidase subunit II
MLLELSTLQVLAWITVGFTLIMYALTSGFDIGISILLPFIGKTDGERRLLINASGPTWDGNQVWLIIAGALIFAIWPSAFGGAFSAFYLALILVLWTMILRPTGFEYRSKRPEQRWRNNWDWGLFISGLVPALVFGVAFGNLLLGLPYGYDPITMRAQTPASFLQLFQPFTLLAGVISLLILLTHGAAYLTLRTRGVVKDRAQKVVIGCALLYILLFVIASLWAAFWLPGYQLQTAQAVASALATQISQSPGGWLANFNAYPWFWLAPALGLLGALLCIKSARRCAKGTLFASSLMIIGTILTAALAMFPFILPSSTNLNQSLTIWNASAPRHSLNLVLAIVGVMTPVIFVYTATVYAKHWKKGPLSLADIEKQTAQLY